MLNLKQIFKIMDIVKLIKDNALLIGAAIAVYFLVIKKK